MSNIKLVLCFIVTSMSLLYSNCICAAQIEGPVLEIVIFHTKPGVSPKSVLTAATTVTPILQSMPGFISRTIAEDQQKNEWVDVVKWKSLKYALLAANEAPNKPGMQRFASLMSDCKMYHFSIRNLTIKP